ncbi:aquaporin Z [Humibacillus xanthopallidus]|uniref:Aquaporin Z n=1 Tax=Humibacillus xanthopallidus TaxID=412689 RepID=A0A543I0K1_9MICO|nr:aquaporin Z [Humibacillus xanthopallidus]TQM64015.1 aquaporin Z [Humibacillus xanthopallidus]
MYTPKLRSRLAVEALGTFWLVFIGCGSAIFNGKFLVAALSDSSPVNYGIGHLGVAIAFGLSVTTMAYAVGHVSGAHFNPAVTIGIAIARRFEWKDVPAYVGAQVVGGLLAGGALAGLVKSRGLPVTGNLAANGYGEHSPGGFGLGAVLVVEALVTAFFVYIILGATKSDAPQGFAPLAIGFGLLIAYLVAIPVSNGSINPARSTAVAFFNGNDAGLQLWAFWVAPIVGALIAGVTFAWITGEDRADMDIDGSTDDVDNAARDAAGNPVLDS